MPKNNYLCLFPSKLVYACNLKLKIIPNIFSLMGITDLLRPSVLPERLKSTCGEAVLEVSGSGRRDVSVTSGLELVSSEVSGKTIGMEKNLVLGDP